jgi:hypothetical protein
MKRAMLLAGVAMLLAVPGSASARPSGGDQRNAAKECKSLRGDTQESRAGFAATYPNFGHCVAQHARQEAAERHAAKHHARRECSKRRRALGRRAFGQRYGKGRAGFRGCVARAAKRNKARYDRRDRARIHLIHNAAKWCMRERQRDPAGFEARYGTGAKPGKRGQRRSAFGKCVSQAAKNRPWLVTQPYADPFAPYGDPVT